MDEALVYKRKFETDDQMLVVYIGEEPGKDAIMPLFRHRENIQSKCGTRLINQWGWMSFISETDNEKLVNDQQCIHDYFSEIDDVDVVCCEWSKSCVRKKYSKKNADPNFHVWGAERI